MKKQLNVPVLSQRDPRWANQRLGTVNGTTIGGYGCIITCMTMYLKWHNHNLTPADMDNWLTENRGYTDGFGGFSPNSAANLYVNDSIARQYPGIKYDKTIFCSDSPAPINQIIDYLMRGEPVVVMVDFDHDSSDGIQTHFVLVVGVNDDGTLLINDPWYGDTVFFTARYGDQAKGINQMNFFSCEQSSASASVSPSSSASDSLSASSSISPSISPSASISASASPTYSPSEQIPQEPTVPQEAPIEISIPLWEKILNFFLKFFIKRN